MFGEITRIKGNTIVLEPTYSEQEILLRRQKAAGFAGNQREVSNDNRGLLQIVKTGGLNLLALVQK